MTKIANIKGVLRQLAFKIHTVTGGARGRRCGLGTASEEKSAPSLADVLQSAPDISGPEFDPVFEAIERLRHDPTAMRTRDTGV